MSGNLKKILIILVVGLFIGIGLIVLPSNTSNNEKQSTEEETPTKSIEELQAEIDDINSRLIPLTAQRDQELEMNGKTERYNKLDAEVNKLQSGIDKFNAEIELINKSNDVSVNDSKDNSLLKVIGIIVIFISIIVSGVLYFIENKKNNQITS